MGDLHADLAALVRRWESTRDRLRERAPADSTWSGDKMDRREAQGWDEAAKQLRARLAAHTPPSEPATEDPRLLCSGSSECAALRHWHGCFADLDGSDCDDPDDHAPLPTVADRDAGLSAEEQEALRVAIDRDETDETDGPWNDTRHVFAAVERILAARAQPEGSERAISSLVQTIGRFSDALEDVVERIETWGALNRTLLLEIASENGWSDLLPDRAGEWTEVQP